MSKFSVNKTFTYKYTFEKDKLVIGIFKQSPRFHFNKIYTTFGKLITLIYDLLRELFLKIIKLHKNKSQKIITISGYNVKILIISWGAATFAAMFYHVDKCSGFRIRPLKNLFC